MVKDKITRNDFSEFPTGRRLVIEGEVGTTLRLGEEHPECKAAILWIEVSNSGDEALTSLDLAAAIAVRDAINILISERA